MATADSENPTSESVAQNPVAAAAVHVEVAPVAETSSTVAAADVAGAASAQDSDPAAWERVGGPPCATNFDMTLSERQTLIEVGAIGIAQSAVSQVNLMRAVEYILDAKIAGDFVECGVYLGGSIVLIGKTLLRHGITDRRIWLYDTFEGMPKPTEKDVWWNGTPAINKWEAAPKIGAAGSDHVYGPMERVSENCRLTGYPTENLIFVKGLVEDTIPDRVPEKIALLRLDTDYYSSTKHELEQLYPRLVRGGILIIDDYGAAKGARLATDEYAKEHGLRLFLARVDASVRFAVKIED